ncbi:MAG: hypothetical protein LBB48_04475 [Treponema sp.]|nr:hypothetical protein [Treponema sp.]
MEWLYCTYKLVRKNGARGIDGVGAEAYEGNLWENLTNLLTVRKLGASESVRVPGG